MISEEFPPNEADWYVETPGGFISLCSKEGLKETLCYCFSNGETEFSVSPGAPSWVLATVINFERWINS